jgi:hypothetical protein
MRAATVSDKGPDTANFNCDSRNCRPKPRPAFKVEGGRRLVMLIAPAVVFLP